MSRDEFRERCADAAMKAWSVQAVLCDHSQIIPIGSIVDAVLAVASPLITDLPAVGLDDPCVECGEAFEEGDRVSWRLRFLPQGLIHEECR